MVTAMETAMQTCSLTIIHNGMILTKMDTETMLQEMTQICSLMTHMNGKIPILMVMEMNMQMSSHMIIHNGMIPTGMVMGIIPQEMTQICSHSMMKNGMIQIQMVMVTIKKICSHMIPHNGMIPTKMDMEIIHQEIIQMLSHSMNMNGKIRIQMVTVIITKIDAHIPMETYLQEAMSVALMLTEMAMQIQRMLLIMTPLNGLILMEMVMVTILQELPRITVMVIMEHRPNLQVIILHQDLMKM